MTTIMLTDGLFRDGQEEIVRLAPRTYVGMAHFAGTGPEGKTCRECDFWATQWKWARVVALGHGGFPMPGRCRKHTVFAMRKGEQVPHDAEACKHFAPTENPQPLRRPEKPVHPDGRG